MNEPAHADKPVQLSVTKDDVTAQEARQPVSAADLPARAGRYLIEGEIARGGMGAVLRATDPELNRPLAVKILLAAHAGRPELARRFLEEAQVMGQLQHPGVPPIHDIGRLDDGRPFFAMKLIKGRTLAELLKEWQCPAEELPRWLGVFEQVCQAVAYAHSKHVIHRDLKPSNVMVGAFGEVQVMDWGLAKVLKDNRAAEPEVSCVETARSGSAEEWTSADTLLGTLPYMAPEQARGDVAMVDQRADVFGLGAILCVILTGQAPYRGPDHRRQARRAELADAFARLEACGAEAELVSLARACLAAEVDERPANAGAVAESVRGYERSVAERLRQSELERAQAQVQAREERKRRRLAVGLAAAVLALVIGGGGGAWWVQQQRAVAEARDRQARAVAEARRQQADQKAGAVLENARGLLAEGWKAHDLAKLKQAKAEADRAVDIARSGEAGEEVLEQCVSFRAEAEERLGRAEKNHVLLAALLDMARFEEETGRYGREESAQLAALAKPSLDERYVTAFRRWGLEVDRLPEAEVVRRLQREPAVLVQEVIAALDSWTLERRAQARRGKMRPEGWQRLLRLANRLDRNDQRANVRALLSGEERFEAPSVVGLVGAPCSWPALWEVYKGPVWRRVVAARGQVDPARDPVLTVKQAALLSWAARDTAGWETLLRQALAARPQEVVLLDLLGWLLEEQGRWGEAIECRRAIRALRPGMGVALARVLGKAGRAAEQEAVLRDLIRQKPDNFELYVLLSFALRQQRKLDEAVAAVRKAIRLKPNSALVNTSLGFALIEKPKPDEAEVALQKALDQKPGDPVDYVALLGLAIAQRDQGKLDAAEAAVRKAIKLKKEDYRAYSLLGDTLRRQKKLDEALAAHRQAIALKPDSPEVYFDFGNTLGESKKLDEAEVALRKAIALKPDYAEAYNSLGMALRNQMKLPAAEEAFRQAIALKPNYPEAHYNLGDALGAQQKLAAAEDAFRKAIALKPDYPEAHFSLGYTFFVRKKWHDAEAAYRQAIVLKPEFAEAYNHLGGALKAQNKLKRAEAAVRKAIDLQPDSHEAYNNLGVVLEARKKLPEAEEAHCKAIKLKPDYPEAYNNLGEALRGQNRLADAVSAFRKAIDLKPDFAQAYENLGKALGADRKWAEAVAAFRKAVELKPDFAEAYVGLGATLYILHGQKMLAEVVAAFNRAIALKPDDPDAYMALGVLFLEQKEPGKAAEVFRKAIQVKRDDPRLHVHLGICLLRLKKFADAEKVIRKAIALQPNDAVAYHNLGQVLGRQNKLHEAETAYRKAIALQPDLAGAHKDLAGNLLQRRKPEEAEAVCRKALALQPDLPEAHNNLGQALLQRKKPQEAEAAFARAVALKPDFVEAHTGLGFALFLQQKIDQAVAALRKAIAIDSKHFAAHVALGSALMQQGRFAQARDSLRRGLALIPADHPGRKPLAPLLQQSEQMLARDKLLTAVLKGEAKPKDAAERLALAWLCQQPYKRQYTAAARFYTEAFREQPKLAENLQAGYRYDAACVTVLAAAGKGEGAAKLEDKERVRLQAQALAWLKADLAVWTKLAEGPAPQRLLVREKMAHWLADPDLAGVRDKAARQKLPAAERDAWSKLWADVEALRGRVTAGK
jgi:Flp pilus assembly protein TadD